MSSLSFFLTLVPPPPFHPNNFYLIHTSSTPPPFPASLRPKLVTLYSSYSLFCDVFCRSVGVLWKSVVTYFWYVFICSVQVPCAFSDITLPSPCKIFMFLCLLLFYILFLFRFISSYFLTVLTFRSWSQRFSATQSPKKAQQHANWYLLLFGSYALQ